MSEYTHMTTPHVEHLELSPFRDAPGSRVSSLQDNWDLVSSMATEDGNDGVPRSMSPSHGTMELGHSETDVLRSRIEPKYGAVASNKPFLPVAIVQTV
jgi:hypothetical protein